MSAEKWHKLPDTARWHRLQDGLEDLLAEKVGEESSPWRAAAYGFLWIRFFWWMSRDEAQEVLSKKEAIRAALEAQLRGKKGAGGCGGVRAPVVSEVTIYACDCADAASTRLQRLLRKCPVSQLLERQSA